MAVVTLHLRIELYVTGNYLLELSRAQSRPVAGMAQFPVSAQDHYECAIKHIPDYS